MPLSFNGDIVGGLYEVGSRGEQLLVEFLRAKGRDVERSDRKTFDLIVDGRYAEVKTSEGPYSKLGFVSLTRMQHQALTEGIPFTVFLVCNTKTPDQLEVIEFDAAELLREAPTVEPTYYWYRSQLDKCRSRHAQSKLPSEYQRRAKIAQKRRVKTAHFDP
jgi:hypothetical protein